MDPSINQRMGDRRGVALILVIGMLALMMVLGVTFSIFMRSERAAAGNFRRDVQGRELLEVALARALDGIESSVGDIIYPPWDILQSSGGGDVNTAALSGAVTNWIPWAVLGETNAAPRWIDIPSMGRVSFLVLNCSGLLDANYAGGLTRSGGANANEIQVASLPGAEVSDAASLASGRPYQTVQELNMYYSHNGGGSAPLTNFVTFSAALTNNVVSLEGSAATLVGRQSVIVAAFTNSGFSQSQAETLFINLIDYVDTDSLPGNLGVAGVSNPDCPSVEHVPMVNEVVISNTVEVTQSGTNFNISGSAQLSAEVLFPFVGCSNTASAGYQLNVSAVFSNSTPQYYPGSVPPLSKKIRSFIGGYSTSQLTVTWPFTGTDTALPPGANIAMSATITASVVDPASNVVDRVVDLPFNWTVPLQPDGVGKWKGGVLVSSACSDPRMNNDLGSWTQVIGSDSLGATNSAALTVFSKTWADGDFDMFVKNAPLETTGELGYLFFGSPGQTVRLYKHGTTTRGSISGVLDSFSMGTVGAKSLKGRVNLNSKNRNALCAVFKNVPLQYPHGDIASRADDVLVGNVVDGIIAKSKTNEFANLSEIGLLNWGTLLPGTSDLGRESIIRNAADLLTIRQNYFVILLCAQAGAGVNSQVKGIAEVWRDPKPATGHQKFIQLYKILNN